jgi:PAS domain S-box-containing protein
MLTAICLLVIAAQLFWIYLAHRRVANRDERFRIITENAADLIALVDTKSHRLYNSPSSQRILTYSLAELAHTPIFERIRPADRFKVLEAAREARATGVGKSLQYRLRHKNGWAISHRICQLTGCIKASDMKNETRRCPNNPSESALSE